MHLPDNFSQKPPDTISHDGFAKHFTGNKPITIMRQGVGRDADHQHGVTLNPPFAAQSLKIAGMLQPKLPLHPLPALMGFPVDLFDMARRHRQFMTTAQTAALQHFAPVARVHPLAEAMHAGAPANFWLPGTLG